MAGSKDTKAEEIENALMRRMIDMLKDADTYKMLSPM